MARYEYKRFAYRKPPEIGGTAEEAAAEYIKAEVKKPMVGFIAGATAPDGATAGGCADAAGGTSVAMGRGVAGGAGVSSRIWVTIQPATAAAVTSVPPPSAKIRDRAIGLAPSWRRRSAPAARVHPCSLLATPVSMGKANPLP